MFLIRTIHLLALTAVFPMAAYYVKHVHPELIQQMEGGSAAFILIGSLFLVIFHVMFEVRYFPLEQKEAQKSMLALAGNIGASSFMGAQSEFFGSYSACFRIGVMYTVYFGLMAFIFLVGERKKFFHYTNNGYIVLLLFLFICSVACLYLLFPLYMRQVMSEKNSWIIFLGVGMLGLDTYLHTKNLLRHNMFQFDPDKNGEFEARENVMMTWGIAGFLLVIVSYVGVIIISTNSSIT